MSLSQMQQSEDLRDQMTILVGSSIRLLRGEAGVFVVSNEAFDPQSSAEYTPYRLSESALATLLASIDGGAQLVAPKCLAPNSANPLVVDLLSPTVVARLKL